MDPQLHIESFKEESLPLYLDFLLSDFCKRQPMNVALNIPEATTRKVFTGLLQRSFESGFSSVLYNEKQEIIGLVALIERLRSEAHFAVKYSKETDKEPVAHFSRLLEERFDVWNRIPEYFDKVIWVSLISVRQDYMRKGLAKLLINHSLDLAKKAGFDASAANAGAFQSQYLFEKLDFHILCEVFHEEIVDENGDQILKCLDETISNQLVFKYL